MEEKYQVLLKPEDFELFNKFKEMIFEGKNVNLIESWQYSPEYKKYIKTINIVSDEEFKKVVYDVIKEKDETIEKWHNILNKRNEELEKLKDSNIFQFLKWKITGKFK